MNRFQAFSIHFLISTVIFAGLAYLLLYVWYPGLFFDTDGGWEGLRIILAVDLVLGPALTLIIFKQGKPGLKFDLACIGIFQLVCLSAGTYLVFSERPIAIVYVDGQFTSVSSDTFAEAGLELPDFNHFPGPYPKWVMVDLPKDINEIADLRGSMFRKHRILPLAVDLYIPFDPSATDFVNQPYDQEKLLDRDRRAQQIPQWLAQHGGALQDYRFYPLGTRFDYVFLGYETDGIEPLGVLETPAPI